MPPQKVQKVQKVQTAQSQSRANIYMFSEDDRARFVEKITDCNRKLACLRQTINGYEIHNETLQKAYDKLDEDRADIIAYLKKSLNWSIQENAELKRKVTSLEELRVIEIAEFKMTIEELQRNFTKMQVQLTSENKLQSGKLNTLEELRIIKEDLMKKFEKQEHAFEEQAKKYKILIYDTEKQLVIDKNKMKKGMDERILNLIQAFQDASEIRIAACTHKVIRENIALNNQLDSLLVMQTKMAEQNEKFREGERAARCAMEVAEEQQATALNKSNMQLKHIDKLTAEFEAVSKQKAFYDMNQFDTAKIQAEIQRLSKTNEKLSLKVRVLEQILHATLGEQSKSVVETAKLLRECETFKNILKESAFAVQAALKTDHWTTLDPCREIMDRKTVLIRILGVIDRYRDAARAESKESLLSLSNIYEKGDLGFEVKPVSSKKSQALVDAAGGAKTVSLISFEDKRSDISVSSPLSLSWDSLKTISNIELVPVDDEISDSQASVASLHSSFSPSIVKSEEREGDLTAPSRVEMQKSLMQNLALSQSSTQKLRGMDSKLRFGSDSQKSIISGQGGSDDIEGEHHNTMPEEDESGNVQDIA